MIAYVMAFTPFKFKKFVRVTKTFFSLLCLAEITEEHDTLQKEITEISGYSEVSVTAETKISSSSVVATTAHVTKQGRANTS